MTPEILEKLKLNLSKLFDENQLNQLKADLGLPDDASDFCIAYHAFINIYPLEVDHKYTKEAEEKLTDGQLTIEKFLPVAVGGLERSHVLLSTLQLQFAVLSDMLAEKGLLDLEEYYARFYSAYVYVHQQQHKEELSKQKETTDEQQET